MHVPLLHPLCFALALCLIAAAIRAAPSVVPAPVRMDERDGEFTLDAETRLVIAGSPDALAVAEMLAARLRPATGLRLHIEALDGGPWPSNAIVLHRSGNDGDSTDEGYTLDVTPERVLAEAAGRRGLFYATQTLRQLLPPEVEAERPAPDVRWTVPAVDIEDAPRFRWRGHMLDSSRHMQSVAFIKRTLDRMAYHKLNVFHWHIVDDNGWRLESKRYPLLTELGGWRTERDGSRYGGFYSQEEVRDIVRHADERGITVVPEIEMPGHSAGAVAAYPFLSCRPDDRHETPPIGSGMVPVCAGKESSYTFFESILDEAMELFPSEVIHIGGDEVRKDSWRACPHCQAAIKREGLRDEKELQHYFIHRLAEYLKSKGRRLQGWNEIMEGGPLPDGVIMHEWIDPQSGAKAARAGNDVVRSPVAWAYFDYSYDTTPLRKVYDAEPIPPDLSDEEQARILGPHAALWTEWLEGDKDVDDYTWPRLIALAEIAWSPASTRDWDGFLRRMESSHYRRLALSGLGTPGVAPEAIAAHLAEHSSAAPARLIGEWSPDTISESFQMLEWDVTPLISSAGAHIVGLDYESGANALLTEGAWLIEDGREVSHDSGKWTAGPNGDVSRYRLRIVALKPGATYTLRIRGRGDGGRDSRGRVVLRGKGHH
jgi:hexosaminidase